MRQFRRPIISLISTVILTVIFTIIASRPAIAMPVYLRVDSRFPSGQYSRATLEGRTRKIQVQTWLRVETADLKYGWVPIEDVLTPLHLTTHAILKTSTPARSEMSMESAAIEILTKNAHLEVIEVIGSWTHVHQTGKFDRQSYWVPSDLLKLSPSAGVQKIFVPKPSPIYMLPGPHARIAFESKASAFYRVSRAMPGWLQIQTPAGDHYIRQSDTITLDDLGETGARPLSNLIPLRSAPLPYANLLQNIPSGTALRVLAMQTLRWGIAKLPDVGEICWPIDDDPDRDQWEFPRERLSTPLLFKRKIFDMASHPSSPELKFVSAEGIYRTANGTEWTKLPLFQDKNYPIAIARTGAVFVGPYLSDDQGENFTQWIRWDALVLALRRRMQLAPQSLQIQEISLEDQRGQRVVLKLNVGESRPVKLLTEDQGVSWKML